MPEEDEHKNEPTSDTAPREIQTSDFVERAKKMFLEMQKNSSVYGERLRYAFATDPESFKEQLDQLVEDVAEKDPEFIDLIKRLQEARRVGGNNAGTDIIGELKQLRARIREITISELGLPDEARFTAIESARQRVKDLIETAPSTPKTPKDILIALGIRTPSEDGKSDGYAFPYNLMPDSVNAKWKTYLAAVAKHVLAERNIPKVEAAGGNVTDARNAVTTADRARTFAHDSVTTDVNAILALEGNEGWEWKNTRQLLASMRDQEFSNNETELIQKAHNLVDSHTSPISVIEALSHQSERTTPDDLQHQ
ncbi:MAG: hypothetical protein JWM52_479 [Candidatus Saccharibacteria bacterium]|nr:hypothetical protein [Candidatus Saccharibacteria bacterium]